MTVIARRTLWASGMPSPDSDRAWRHEGGSYYVDVTDLYVDVATYQGAVDLVREAHALLRDTPIGSDRWEQRRRAWLERGGQ